jgi:hypothetical protein
MGHAAAAIELEADSPQAMHQVLLGPGFNADGGGALNKEAVAAADDSAFALCFCR